MTLSVILKKTLVEWRLSKAHRDQKLIRAAVGDAEQEAGSSARVGAGSSPFS